MLLLFFQYQFISKRAIGSGQTRFLRFYRKIGDDAAMACSTSRFATNATQLSILVLCRLSTGSKLGNEVVLIPPVSGG